MYSRRKVFLIFCVSLNIVNINSGDKKSWPTNNFGPNFDPDYPQFTPFNSGVFLDITSDMSVSNADRTNIRHNYVNQMNQNSYTNDDVFKKDVSDSVTDDYRFSSTLSNTNDIKERMKPLKSFMLGLYENYRSTYLGNRTHIDDVENNIENTELPKTRRKKNKTKIKKNSSNLNSAFGDEVKYNVGPGVNVSLDRDKELVNVYLDEDCLKDVFTGRGKKYDLISKILPLFILPFLIQSAIVPFVVSTLKLLLIKSIVVGKIAIFLLVISAFKNNERYGYENAPSYYVDPPSRRSEPSAGYRVEGKPTTWVN